MPAKKNLKDIEGNDMREAVVSLKYRAPGP
jgi:hypothetical protein